MTALLEFILIIAAGLAALVAAFLKNRDHCRRWAWASALGLIALASLTCASYFSGVAMPIDAELAEILSHFETVRTIAVVFQLFLTILSCASLIAAPKRELHRATVTATFIVTSMLIALSVANNAWEVALLWGLSIVPRYWVAHRSGLFGDGVPIPPFLRTGMLVAHGLGVLGILMIIALAGGDGSFPAVREAIANASKTEQFVTFACIVPSLLVRLGIFPFHHWTMAFAAASPAFVTALWLSSFSGIVLLLVFVLPVFGAHATEGLQVLAFLGLVSALFNALIIWGRNSFSARIRSLVLSQSGLLVVGVCTLNSAEMPAALVFWLGVGVSAVGLIMLADMLVRRVGEVDMRRFSGLYREVPLLAGLFFVFGMSLVGFPGSLAFAADDLLIATALFSHPLVGIALILVLTSNTIAFVATFARVFLGHDNRPLLGAPRDLMFREKCVLFFLLLVLGIFGIAPQMLLANIG